MQMTAAENITGSVGSDFRLPPPKTVSAAGMKKKRFAGEIDAAVLLRQGAGNKRKDAGFCESGSGNTGD